MNCSGASRESREWKAKLFRHLRRGDMFFVFSAVSPYGKRIFIVTRHINPHTVEVIELTSQNIFSIVDSSFTEKTYLTYQEFVSETFHICETQLKI